MATKRKMTVEIPVELWNKLKKAAKDELTTPSAITRKLIADYVGK